MFRSEIVTKIHINLQKYKFTNKNPVLKKECKNKRTEGFLRFFLVLLVEGGELFAAAKSDSDVFSRVNSGYFVSFS